MSKGGRKTQEHEFPGTVVAVHGRNNYVVEVDFGDRSADILCALSGNMLRFKINVMPEDKVSVVVPPPYDRGRITFREK